MEAAPATNGIMVSIEGNVLRRKTAPRLLNFLKHKNLVLRELKTGKLCQVLRALLAVHTYVLKNGQLF